MLVDDEIMEDFLEFVIKSKIVQKGLASDNDRDKISYQLRVAQRMLERHKEKS